MNEALPIELIRNGACSFLTCHPSCHILGTFHIFGGFVGERTKRNRVIVRVFGLFEKRNRTGSGLTEDAWKTKPNSYFRLGVQLS